MTNNYKRTNKTSLSDDELLLMDALFDMNLFLIQLIKENYGAVTNFKYTHHFSDQELEQKLFEWITAGILHREKREELSFVEVQEQVDWGDFYCLTEKGGSLWQLEREPPWDRYIDTAFWDDEETGDWLISIRSPSLETAGAYLSQVCQGLMYQADVQQARTIIHPDENLLSWKTFPTVYEIVAPAEGPEWERDIDFDLYESRRTWWRDVDDLQRLPADPHHPL